MRLYLSVFLKRYRNCKLHNRLRTTDVVCMPTALPPLSIWQCIDINSKDDRRVSNSERATLRNADLLLLLHLAETVFTRNSAN